MRKREIFIVHIERTKGLETIKCMAIPAVHAENGVVTGYLLFTDKRYENLSWWDVGFIIDSYIESHPKLALFVSEYSLGRYVDPDILGDNSTWGIPDFSRKIVESFAKERGKIKVKKYGR